LILGVLSSDSSFDLLRLSIVIPVYNVEAYLERCIRSLETQDILQNEYEIIVINDGSPDNSREVVIRLMKEFNNLKLLDQANMGVSNARNNGIALAKGTYLLFIDPDDFVEGETLKNILWRAESDHLQIYFLGYSYLDVNGRTVAEVFSSDWENRMYTGLEAYFLSRGDGRVDPDRSWAILFEREFIIENDLNYLPNVPYLEDGEFLARVLCLAGTCGFDGRPFYKRTTRIGSATNSKMILSKKALNGFFIAAFNLKAFREKKDLSDKKREFLNQPIAKFILLPFNTLAVNYEFVEFIKLCKCQMIKGFKLDLSGVKKTYQMYGKVFNTSRYLLFLVIIINVQVRTLIRRLKTMY